MKLSKIQVKNFRILQDLDLDLENDLSLVIGKNNCGKTSLLSVLDKFINGGKSFAYDDFNNEFKSTLFKAVENNDGSWKKEKIKGIELYLFIQYDESDNLSNLRDLFFDLDVENHTAILKFEYVLEYDKFESFITAFNEYCIRHAALKRSKAANFATFAKEKQGYYFQSFKKAVRFDVKTQAASIKFEDETILKTNFDVSKIVSFKYISASRETDNKDTNSTLSSLSGRYYAETKPSEDDSAIREFEDSLVKTDVSLTEIYQGLFDNVIRKVKKFGGVRENETIVKFISTLSQQQLLKSNTTVVYEAGNYQLPETYNGLGYLNLISIIIEVETLLSKFRHDKDSTKNPANINILLIEEPEAHTHPQMQYIFIKNIKDLLKNGSSGHDGKRKIDLQTIITTHSSHIVAESSFNDIKYFKHETSLSVISKNLKDLEIQYKTEKNPENNYFKFLKQYLTLNCAEIFFADKAVLYEGDTERILLPAMMKKIDEEEHDNNERPLLSQNISLIESGAYSQIFDKFLSFIGIKTLIITDIDSCDNERKACTVKNGTNTSNGALKHYYKLPLKSRGDKSELAFFVDMSDEDKILINRTEGWIAQPDGNLVLVFQESKSDYYPRSFEDSFIQINRTFISDNISEFASLKKSEMFNQSSSDSDYQHDAYVLSQECIRSKASFAMDVLINSIEHNGHSYSNWKIPSYIKKGLLWLRKESDANSKKSFAVSTTEITSYSAEEQAAEKPTP
jgi:predicted ATP-dependent endonuclease of OLD family